MSYCNSKGIRIYPQYEFGYYVLIIEHNKTSNFFEKDIKKTVRGEKRYKTNNDAWIKKLHDLYEYLYINKLNPKSKAA